MILARRRTDLRKQGLLIPTKFHGSQELDDWHKAFQPDELDDSEFNLVLLYKNGEVYDLAIAIDFEFKEVPDNWNIIDQAKEFAEMAHANQLRDGGEAFIVHPAKVAEILAFVTDDQDIIAAGWLHDVIEDTEVTYDQVEFSFGKRIADLVNEVTHEGSDKDGHYFPRLKTREGVMIKFADRLSNISDMATWNEKRVDHYIKKSKFWRSEKNANNDNTTIR